MSDDTVPGNHAAIAEVGVTMTLPIASFDPATGAPIFDYDAAQETGYGLIVQVHIHAIHPLEVARKMLVDAIAKVDAGIAEIQAAGEDDDSVMSATDFDVDAAIAGILDHGPAPEH